MIRGPVFPLARDGVWRVFRERTDVVERGLRIVAEQLELGTKDLGVVDALLRDAGGGPVLVFATDAADATLCARVVAAHSFWQRNAETMPRAVPEGDLSTERRCRLIVIGADLPKGAAETLERLAIDDLQVVEVEPFQVAGQERLAVRISGSAPMRGVLDESMPASVVECMTEFVEALARLGPGIQIDGDRFSRRASHAGQSLCECRCDGDSLVGAVSGEPDCRIHTAADLRVFTDRVARRYLQIRGIDLAVAPAGDDDESDESSASVDASAARTIGGSAGRGTATGELRGALEMLRQHVSKSRLSREEFHAFEDPKEQEGPMAGG